jgi:C4-dicarboxylate-specific signal transduction histidine kinase
VGAVLVAIALTVAVILIQAALIMALLREHRRRQARQRMSELAHVNRFSTADELTASIAHEINQPLGSILANAEDRRRDPELAEA